MPTRPETFRVAIRKFAPFEAAIRKQWTAFQAATGTHLQLETQALDLHPLYDSYFGREDLKRGAWDVGFLTSDWFATAYERQALLDIAPLLAAGPPEGYPDGWTRSLLDLQRFGDVTLGLPYHDGPECLIYRKDLFEDLREQEAYEQQYGEPLRVPRTWEAFHRVARFFTRADHGLYGTTFAAYPDGHNTVYDFCLQLWTRGGELFDRAGRLCLDTPETIAALTFYRQILSDASAIHPRAREMDSVQAGLAFAAGQVAMMVNWFGFASMAATIADSSVKGRVDIAPVPHAEGSQTVSLNSYWILGIGAGSPHAATAYGFLRHCASAAMDKLLTLEGGIGCRRSTWQDAEVNETVPFYHQIGALHASARELPRLPHWGELATAIDALVLDTINTDVPVADLVADHQSRLAYGP